MDVCMWTAWFLLAAKIIVFSLSKSLVLQSKKTKQKILAFSSWNQNQLVIKEASMVEMKIATWSSLIMHTLLFKTYARKISQHVFYG